VDNDCEELNVAGLERMLSNPHCSCPEDECYPGTCKSCRQLLLMRLIYKDIRNDTGVIIHERKK